MEGASKRTLLISYSNKPPAYLDAGGSSLLVTCLLLGQLVRDITAVFLSLTNAYGQQILNLTVYRTEILGRPGCDFVVELLGYPQGNLFLLAHLNTGCRCLPLAVRRDYRRGQPAD